MTWTRSSYMEPVTSKTNARVDAPSGMSSFVAPARASCPAQNATDSARDSHTNLQPISAPRCFSVSSWVFCSRQSEPQNESRLEARDIGLSKMDWSVFWKKMYERQNFSQPLSCVITGFLCSFCAQKSQPLTSLWTKLQRSQQLQQCLLSAVRSPCSALSYKDHLSAGQKVPQAQTTPCRIAVLWLDEMFWVTSRDRVRNLLLSSHVQAPTYLMINCLGSQMCNGDRFYMPATHLLQLSSIFCFFIFIFFINNEEYEPITFKL